MTENLLIEPEELVKQVGKSDWVIVDCRADLMNHELGRQQYLENHIPGAQFADLELDMSATAGIRGRHPLPVRMNFWGFVRSIGISNDTNVVAYDDGKSAYATRFWWLLRWIGHEHTRVLNGGFDHWTQKKLPVTPTIVEPGPGKFTLRKSLTKEIAMQDIDGEKQMLIDARTQERFDGLVEPIDHKAGHIPGGSCFPFVDNLNADGTFNRENHRFNEIKNEDDVVCYCGSGVTATHNIFAMMLAGFEEPKLYPGSWSEWIEYPENPVATAD